MKSNFSNNPVFTMPEDLPAGDKKTGDTSKGKYTKAVKGSFDENFFIDSATGEFCFPDYNNNPNAIVKIKDLTGYGERKESSIDEFEYYFFSPVFEVPDFETFIEQLPPGYCPDGISVEKLLEQFEEFGTLISGEEKTTDFYERYRDPFILLNAKLIEPIDLSKLKPEVPWDHIAPVTVDEICLANGIKPVEDNDKNIKSLVAKQVKFPFEMFRPTALVKELYWKLVNLYVDDIKASTDHFHPLYLQPLWEEVFRRCGNQHIEDMTEKILEKKFWKQRLSHGK